MSWRTTGVLFVVLVAVAALVFLESRQTEPDEETPTAEAAVTEQGASLFGQTSAEDVARLEITSSPDVLTSFSRQDDGSWVMTVPTSTLVISQTVNSAVSGLVTARTQRTFAPDENPLEAYGLADPSREIIVAVSRGEQVFRYRLQVGNEAPTGNGYYVLREGDERVHLLAKTTLDTLFALATNPPLPESLPATQPETGESDATPASP